MPHHHPDYYLSHPHSTTPHAMRKGQALRRDAVFPFSILLTPKRVEARGRLQSTLALTPLKSTSLRDRAMGTGVLRPTGTLRSAKSKAAWVTSKRSQPNPLNRQAAGKGGVLAFLAKSAEMNTFRARHFQADTMTVP